MAGFNHIAEAPKSTRANKANDLFTAPLTNHYETCVQLGGGKNCLLTPKMLDKHNVQITMAIESKSAAGKTQDLSVTQVVTRTDRPLEVAVGDFALSFTPHLN